MEFVGNRAEGLEAECVQVVFPGRFQQYVPQGEVVQNVVVVPVVVETHPLSVRRQFSTVGVPVCFAALPNRSAEISQVDRQDLDAEPLKQIRLVGNRGPEEVDALSDLANLHRPHSLDHPGGADEAVDAALELVVFHAAIVDVAEANTQGVKHSTGGERAAERVAQAAAVGQRRLVARRPQQRGHAAPFGDHPGSSLRAEIAVGQKEGVDWLLLKKSHNRLDMLLVAHHAVGQHAFQVHVADFPRVQLRTNQSLQPHRIFMGEDEFADGAKTDQRILMRIHSL